MRTILFSILCGLLVVSCYAPNYETPQTANIDVSFLGSPEVVVTPAGDTIKAVPVALTEPLRLLRDPVAGTKEYHSLYLYPVDDVLHLNGYTTYTVTFLVESMQTSKPLFRVKGITPAADSAK